MVDVFRGSGGTDILRGPSGPTGRFMYDIKAFKKITKTSGVFKDYVKEIQESYRQGFTPYREHKKSTGLWITPLRCYDNTVFALDNVGAFEVTNDPVKKLVYWVEKEPSDGDALNSIVGPAGPQGKNGAVGPQGKRGADGIVGPPGKKGSRSPAGVKGPTGLPGSVNFFQMRPLSYFENMTKAIVVS